MVQYNEIRLGNYIEKYGKWLRVVAITDYPAKKTISAFSESTDCYELQSSDFNPIPLSPDILQRCGFEHQYENKWANGEVELEKYNLSESYYLLNGEERTNWSLRYEYLHQLQNLYYSLVNQELKIQLIRYD